MWPGSDEDEFEDGEEGASEEPACPFCGKIDPCEHLLVYATEGESEWYGRLDDDCCRFNYEIIRAVYHHLKAERPVPDDASGALHELLGFVDLDSFYDDGEGFENWEDLKRYWIELAGSHDAVQRETWDVDSGFPGGEGTRVAMYAKDAKGIIAAVIASAKADIAALQGGAGS